MRANFTYRGMRWARPLSITLGLLGVILVIMADLSVLGFAALTVSQLSLALLAAYSHQAAKTYRGVIDDGLFEVLNESFKNANKDLVTVGPSSLIEDAIKEVTK